MSKIPKGLIEKRELLKCNHGHNPSTFYNGYDHGFNEGVKSVLDSEELKGLAEAFTGILEIGKRDMTNPKYDGYFESAKEALAKWAEFTGGE